MLRVQNSHWIQLTEFWQTAKDNVAQLDIVCNIQSFVLSVKEPLYYNVNWTLHLRWKMKQAHTPSVCWICGTCSWKWGTEVASIQLLLLTPSKLTAITNSTMHEFLQACPLFGSISIDPIWFVQHISRSFSYTSETTNINIVTDWKWQETDENLQKMPRLPNL